MPRRFVALSAALIFSAGCVFTPAVLAQAASAATGAKPALPRSTAGDLGGPSWSSLSAPQRKALAPLERDWSTIDASRKAKWLEIAGRFPSLPADEQQRLQARMAEWAAMTPSQRGQARLSFQEAKQIPPQQKQARWEAYQALSAEERQALAERAKPKATKPAAAGSASMDAVPKRNLAASSPAARPTIKPVAPTVVQAAPGATTTLMNKSPSPPPHQKPGQPKIVATPSQVDRSTLLPKRGPQAALAPTAAASGVAPAQ